MQKQNQSEIKFEDIDERISAIDVLGSRYEYTFALNLIATFMNKHERDIAFYTLERKGFFVNGLDRSIKLIDEQIETIIEKIETEIARYHHGYVNEEKYTASTLTENIGYLNNELKTWSHLRDVATEELKKA